MPEAQYLENYGLPSVPFATMELEAARVARNAAATAAFMERAGEEDAPHVGQMLGIGVFFGISRKHVRLVDDFEHHRRQRGAPRPPATTRVPATSSAA